MNANLVEVVGQSAQQFCVLYVLERTLQTERTTQVADTVDVVYLDGNHCQLGIAALVNS